jgi:hypothetical protein
MQKISFCLLHGFYMNIYFSACVYFFFYLCGENNTEMYHN